MTDFEDKLSESSFHATASKQQLTTVRGHETKEPFMEHLSGHQLPALVNQKNEMHKQFL